MTGSAARLKPQDLDSGCEVWQQNFLKLDLPAKYFNGVFANAALFDVPGQELPRVLLELHEALGVCRT